MWGGMEERDESIKVGAVTTKDSSGISSLFFRRTIQNPLKYLFYALILWSEMLVF